MDNRVLQNIFICQAQMYRSDVESLRDELDAGQEKVLHLSEMNADLCSSQLDTWYDSQV